MSLVHKISQETKFEKYLKDELARKNDECEALLKQLNQLEKEKKEFHEKTKQMQEEKHELHEEKKHLKKKMKHVQRQNESLQRTVERLKNRSHKIEERRALRNLQAEETFAFHAEYEVATPYMPFHHNIFEDETEMTHDQRVSIAQYDRIEKVYRQGQTYVRMCRQGVSGIWIQGWILCLSKVAGFVHTTKMFVEFHPEGDWQPGDDRDYGHYTTNKSQSQRVQNISGLLQLFYNFLILCNGHMNLCLDNILEDVERTRPLTVVEQNALVFYRNLNDAYNLDGGSAGAHVGKVLREKYGIMPDDMSILLDYMSILRFDESRFGTFNAYDIPVDYSRNKMYRY